MVTRDLQFGGIQVTARLVEQASVRPERLSKRDVDMARLIDDTIDASFPASDPPSWTASVARPAPAVVTRAD